MKTVSQKDIDRVNKYDPKAYGEGWGVFTCYGSRSIPEGQLRIQRIDDPGIEGEPCIARPSDAAAIAYVRRRAQAGSRPHRAALRAHCAMPR